MAPAIFSAAHRYSPASFAVTPRILNTALSSTSVLPGLSLLPAFTHTTFDEVLDLGDIGEIRFD